MTASGSEIEREFGFGVVRRLFDPLLRSLGPDERAGLFAGPAALAAAIFGLAGSTTLEVNPAEASLYGLFWLAAALAEKGPLVFAIDDAHWADVASLRFLQYLGRRLDGLPLLLCVAGQPGRAGAADGDPRRTWRRARHPDHHPGAAQRRRDRGVGRREARRRCPGPDPRRLP